MEEGNIEAAMRPTDASKLREWGMQCLATAIMVIEQVFEL